MKKIIYSFFVFLLCSTIAMAQTGLMSDEDHRIMMNEYATNLNTVLTAELPQGITIDQFKKKIVNGELTLSSTAQASILTYAEPLKTYGTQFATTKNLIATTDAEKIFLSSFTPSTLIDENGDLIESDTTGGLSYQDIWQCAVEVCNTVGCNPFGMVDSNSESINLLSKAVTATLTNHANTLGVAVIMGDIDNRFSHYVYLKKMAFNLSKSQNFISIKNIIVGFLNSSKDTVKIDYLISKENLNEIEKLELANSLGFQSIEQAYYFELNMNNDLVAINNEFGIKNLKDTEKYMVISSALKYLNNNNYFSRVRSCVERYSSCKSRKFAYYFAGLIACGTAGAAFGGATFFCAGCAGPAVAFLCSAAALNIYNEEIVVCQDYLSICLNPSSSFILLPISLLIPRPIIITKNIFNTPRKFTVYIRDTRPSPNR
ncbi:hypothetical protein [Flavobacterium luteum]|uniref:Uncharacterized protein n=1 Tax=Flavobacterium luteum TaxID=2026654 RepID=A0A7J5AHC8_9FLAO|nr:hypothetical protein [Flavobacterium luteum]KAB1156920.1 hypothetical protein F6464_06105 [Flavobacterium luteum]